MIRSSGAGGTLARVRMVVTMTAALLAPLVAAAAPPAPAARGSFHADGRIMLQTPAAPELTQPDVAAGSEDGNAAGAPAVPPAVGGSVGRALVGWLELSGSLRDSPPAFTWFDEDEGGRILSDVLEQLETVARSPDYLGVVLYLDWPDLQLSQIDALRASIRRVRDTGKRVVTFAERYDLMTYLLASSADLVLLQHKGDVDLMGLGIEEMYLAGLLDKVGAKADMIQIGQYKGADESLMRAEPSDAWNRNISSLLDDLYGQVVDAIAEGRGLRREQVEAIMRDSWTMRDADYLRRRVVDRLVDRDMIDVTEIEFGDDFVWDESMGRAKAAAPQIDNPFALFRLLFQPPQARARRPSIALIHANGPITSGDSSHGEGLFGSETIGSRTLVEVLGEVHADEQIKAVLVQLDSPGGSALASEVIWQAIREVAEDKPVVVAIGPMAASGGYYLACAADEIYVTPTSIVGSIGVVGGKIALGGTYEKLGITVTRRSRGPFGDMFNSVEPFNDDEREAVRAAMQRVYEQFLDRVSLGRGVRLDDVNAVAEGRLFTGRQAVENGMADHIGTVDDALAALADQVGLRPGTYDVVHFPEPKNFADLLAGMFRTGAAAPQTAVSTDPLQSALAGAARQVMGDAAWSSVSRVLTGLMQLRREPVLVLMPAAVVVR